MRNSSLLKRTEFLLLQFLLWRFLGCKRRKFVRSLWFCYLSYFSDSDFRSARPFDLRLHLSHLFGFGRYPFGMMDFSETGFID